MRSKLLRAMDMFTNERFFRFRLFGEGILVGAFAGLVISLFRGLLEMGEDFRPVIYSFLQANGVIAVAGWILVSLVLAGILSWIVRFEPMCTGSGIPQIKGVLLGRMKMNWKKVIITKLIGGILAIGAGLSLGREGPSVQLGACVGQGTADLSRVSRSEGRFLITAGSGAGLAAAFNAPLAGVIFCLEELTKNFSPLVLMATIGASVTATTVSRVFFGGEPVFHIGTLPVLPIYYFGLLALLGVFTGMMGQLFNKLLIFSLDWYDNLPKQGMFRPLLPLLVAVPLGFFLPMIMGGGNRLVDALVNSNYPLSFLFILMVGKFLFTMLSFGSGVPGGIFLPMLVMGALSGAVFAGVATAAGILDTEWTANFIVFGMAAYFASVVKSPLTGSILIMEMTGSFHHMLSLIIVSMAAAVTAEAMSGEPVYDMLLGRALKKQPQVKSENDCCRVVAEILVDSGSALDGKIIAEISWPDNTLIVNVRRGDKEYVPDGHFLIKAGDFLYLYADDVNIEAIETLAAEGKSIGY